MFTPDPQKQKNIAAIEQLLKDNNLEYDITLVTDSDILVSIANRISEGCNSIRMVCVNTNAISMLIS